MAAADKPVFEASRERRNGGTFRASACRSSMQLKPVQRHLGPDAQQCKRTRDIFLAPVSQCGGRVGNVGKIGHVSQGTPIYALRLDMMGLSAQWVAAYAVINPHRRPEPKRGSGGLDCAGGSAKVSCQGDHRGSRGRLSTSRYHGAGDTGVVPQISGSTGR